MRTTTLALALALTLASAAPAFAQQAERVAAQPVLIDDRAALSPDAAQLAEFEGQVAAMRKTAAPGDVTPDIALLEELTRLGQRRKALEEVRRLRAAYPDNAALAAFEE